MDIGIAFKVVVVVSIDITAVDIRPLGIACRVIATKSSGNISDDIGVLVGVTEFISIITSTIHNITTSSGGTRHTSGRKTSSHNTILEETVRESSACNQIRRQGGEHLELAELKHTVVVKSKRRDITLTQVTLSDDDRFVSSSNGSDTSTFGNLDDSTIM